MATSRLNKEAENKITDSLGEVSELVNSGTSPNEAIAKTASAHGIPVGHIELMVRAFNVGRSEAQRHAGDEAHEKLADFDLADVKSVMDIMYPSIVKSASVLSKDTHVSGAYSRPFNKVEPVKLAPLTPLTKLASSLPNYRAEHDTLGSTRTLSSLIEKIGSASDKLRMDSAATKDKVTYGIAKLANYFRTYGSKPFLVVKDNSERLFGKQASALLGIVLSSNRHLNKQAGTVDDLMAPVEVNDEPYKSIKSCIELAQLHLNKQASSNYLKGLSKQALQLGFNNSLPEDNTGSVLDGMDKLAGRPGVYDLVSKPWRASLDAIQEHGRDSASNNNSADWKFIADQRMQEMALKNIRSSASFADLLANDERISSHHPEDVAFHFNEISKVMPESTTNTAIMRPILRKRLESGVGQVDTADIAQMIGIENDMYGGAEGYASKADKSASISKVAGPYGRGFIDPFSSGLSRKKTTAPEGGYYAKYEKQKKEEDDRARDAAKDKERKADDAAKDRIERKRELEDRADSREREDKVDARDRSRVLEDRGRPGYMDTRASTINSNSFAAAQAQAAAKAKEQAAEAAKVKERAAAVARVKAQKAQADAAASAKARAAADPAKAHADALVKTRVQKTQGDAEAKARPPAQSAQAAAQAAEDASRRRHLKKYDAVSGKEQHVKQPDWGAIERSGDTP